MAHDATQKRYDHSNEEIDRVVSGRRCELTKQDASADNRESGANPCEKGALVRQAEPVVRLASLTLPSRAIHRDILLADPAICRAARLNSEAKDQGQVRRLPNRISKRPMRF